MLLTRTTRQGPARQSPPTSSRPGSAVSSVRTIALARDSDRHGDDAQASASPSAASSKGGAAQLANDDDDGAFSSELPLAAARARCSTTGSLSTSASGCVHSCLAVKRPRLINISSSCLAAALLLSTLRRLLSILLLRHLQSFLSAGIDCCSP